VVGVAVADGDRVAAPSRAGNRGLSVPTRRAIFQVRTSNRPVRALRWVACVRLAAGLLAAVSLPAAAADGPSSHAATRLGAAAIRLDGDLSDPAWREAGVITEFRQREPTEGAAPTHRTEARVVYDDVAIYVGVRAFDSEPDRILAFLTRRDTDSASDWIRSSGR
jgi:hypothetical protein